MATVTSLSGERQLLTVSMREMDQARETVDLLSGSDQHFALRERSASGEMTDVPEELASIITAVLRVMAQGGTVTVSALPAVLSTSVAASMLGVSRPTLMKMIHRGEIPAHLVGTHHKVKAADVLAFTKERRDKERAAFDELRDFEEYLDN